MRSIMPFAALTLGASNLFGPIRYPDRSPEPAPPNKDKVKRRAKNKAARKREGREGGRTMRGFSAIGLVSPKDKSNVGSVLRAAWCYSAAMVAIEGDRSSVRHAADTPQAWKHLPVLRPDSLRDVIPFDAVPVAVDLVDDAVPLPSFQHPVRAFYVFGPEDGTLGAKHLDWCSHRVMVPTRSCMNLAATVNVILYDRMAKADRQARGIRNADLGLTG